MQNTVIGLVKVGYVLTADITVQLIQKYKGCNLPTYINHFNKVRKNKL